MRAAALEPLARLVEAAGGADVDWDRVTIDGSDPVLATRFRAGEASAMALAGCGALSGECWRERTGRRQDVNVDVAAAAVSLLSFAFQRVEGRDGSELGDRELITDFYRTRDDRWVLLHGGFPHLQQGILDLLGIATEERAPKDLVARAVAEWDARELEDAVAEKRLCGAMVRDERAWADHPQGRSLAGVPVVEVVRVADSPPEPFDREGARPLSGVRVLDLTRVLAGPTCARTLAEHGAEVLKITSPDLPCIPLFVMDTGHGKRSARLRLREPAEADRLRELVRDADVFSQGYRGGALDRLGFDEESLFALRPGLVHVSINCYGHEGPWRARGGWEQLAQTVSGVAHENGGDAPALLPAAVTDYTTGTLAALGTLVALLRRAREGGSYRVRVSLTRTAMWLQSLGRTEERGAGIDGDLVRSRLTSSDSPYGKLWHLAPVVQMSETAPHWSQPTVPLGTDPAEWTRA